MPENRIIDNTVAHTSLVWKSHAIIIGINAYKVNKCLKYFDDKLEYDKCRYEHHQEPDFFEKEWRIYLNRTSEFLVKENGEIILEDKDEMVVDRYNY